MAITGARSTGNDDYRALYGELQHAGEYVRVPRRLAAKIGPLSATVLMYLLGTAQAGANRSGWQRVTPGYVESGIGLGPERQEVVLGKLARLGLIEVSGSGASRCVRINVEAVRELLDL